MASKILRDSGSFGLVYKEKLASEISGATGSLGLVYKEKPQQAKYDAKLVPEGTRLLDHLVLYIRKKKATYFWAPGYRLV